MAAAIAAEFARPPAQGGGPDQRARALGLAGRSIVR